MAITYEARVADSTGVALASIVNFVDANGAGLDYVLNAGQVGALTLTVPASFDATLFKLDGRIGVYRAIHGRPATLDGGAVWLIRKWRYDAHYTTVTAYHATDLLRRRIIAYNAGSSESSKAADNAGDQVKAYARENLGALISSSDRDGVETQANISAYLAVQVDLGDGASIAKAAARRTLLDVARELAQASVTAGTYLTFEIVAPTDTTLELRTYATQRGNDHRASSGAPIIFSEEQGNIANVTLDVDRSEEITFVVAGGQGEGTSRLITTALDTSRMGESVFNRREDFADFSNVSDATALQDEADARLRAGRPIVTLTGDLIETPGCTRGIHFDYGDMVTVEFRGQQYDVRLDVIRVSVQGGGQTSQAKMQSVT